MAELAQLRAEKAAALEQKPVAFWWIGPDGKDNGGPYRGMASEFAIDNARNMGCKPQLLYTAPVSTPATVPDDWSIRREGEHIVIQKTDIGGVVVKQNPSDAREIPEAILWALANDLLQSAQEPKP